MAFTFEKLHVYQKAVSFADEACTLTRSFPRGYFFLADQLRDFNVLKHMDESEPRCGPWSGEEPYL